LKVSAFDWIRTTDKTPPEKTAGFSEYMLVTVAERPRYVDIDRYNHRAHEWESHGARVTHWIPLPSPALVPFDELPKT
jgi:hypothetical protein